MSTSGRFTGQGPSRGFTRELRARWLEWESTFHGW